MRRHELIGWLVTVVYNTERAVRYARHGHTRAWSRSVATRIAEVAEPAGRWERRLNWYWQYEQLAGGVLVECESISLSRAVPCGPIHTLIFARGVIS
jgi:hypothetical protein